MSDGIARALKDVAQKVGQAVERDLKTSVTKWYRDTETGMRHSVDSHVRHDTEHSDGFRRIADRTEDNSPKPHGGSAPTTARSGPKSSDPGTVKGGSAPSGSGSGGTGGGSTNGRRPSMPNDPPGSYRDASGRLRDDKGTFIKDPHTNDRKGIDFPATPGTKRKRDASDEGRPGLDRTQRDRDDATARRDAAGKEIDDIAAKYGVDPKDLRSSGNSDALDRLENRGASDDEIQQVKDAARAHRAANTELVHHSETLGMQAGEEVLKQDGYGVISGSSGRPGRPGEADLIGVSDDGTHLRVVEAKGGSAGLGDGRYLHDLPGRAQQGSSHYLNDLLHRDPEFGQYVASHPQFAQDLADGKVSVSYDMVSARTPGNITQTDMTVDPSHLHLHDLAPGR